MQLRNECLMAVKKELAKVGIKPTVSEEGKHVKITWQHNGKPRILVTAKTASDHRASLNIRAEARRILKADGVTPNRVSKNEVTLKKAFEIPEPVLSVGERLMNLEKQVESLTDMLLEFMTSTETSKPVNQSVSVPHAFTGAAVEEDEVEHTVETVFGKPRLIHSAEPDTLTLSPKTLEILNSATRPEKKYARGQLSGAILDVLEFNRGKTPSEIATVVQKDINTVCAYLSKLKKEGKVKNEGRGNWQKVNMT